MSSEYTLKIPATQAKELPMVDLAFEVLKAANTPFYYRDLMMEIAKIKGFSDDQVMQVIAQLYTEINVDGRFACVGSNLWGLKRWYPVDNKSDEMGSAKRPRIINDEDDDLDEEDYTEEEETYTADEEDFDAFDTERDDVGEEEEEEDDLFGEEVEEEAEEIDEEIDAIEEGEEEEDDFDDEDGDDDEEDGKK
ncbi:DNA-directed RNA polymerase subunit delta [Paenibacillus sp. MBLB4367]|uniref:DNA-directed RNA polymerase subunit delta n=1 Tax=Paenibacillus sp. MBLB4367 TaxID=3384767 RepID=UPI0039080034